MKRSAGSKWRRMWAYSKDRRRKRADHKWERQQTKRDIRQQEEKQ